MDAPKVTHVSYEDVLERLEPHDRAGRVYYGVPTGGMIVASLLRHARATHDIRAATHLLDDLIDSGKTRDRFTAAANADKPFIALYDKTGGDSAMGWIRFPWDRDASPTDAVVRLLSYIGEDPRRDGLRDTPARFVKAFAEMTHGYQQKPAEILSRVFPGEDYDEMVVVRRIPFTSLCEHHLMPFTGHVTVGYLPKNRIVGLSKIPRLVRCFSRRLQVQERLTRQITNAIQVHLDPQGCACIVEGVHACMRHRGIQSDGTMLTSSLLGKFRDPAVRSEFLRLAGSE